MAATPLSLGRSGLRAYATGASGVARKAGTERKLRALVTGGAGFLGSHLCERLLSEGYRVVCMDNLRTGSLQNVAHLEDEADFEYVDHDVTSYINVSGELEELYHFASPRSEEHTSELQSRQYLVCRLLLEKKKK